MCGIVGYTGPREAGPILIEGLKRLEYRGYDSAGIALVDDAGDLFVEKRAGKLVNLQTALADRTPHAAIGLAHTRWATHGRPNDLNAHPHRDCTGEITVIHNGIIENFRELRDGLEARGHTLTSETDTEAIAHLVEEAYEGDLADAVRAALAPARGRLRDRGHAHRRGRPAGRCPQERAAHRRPRRRRELPRLGRRGDPRPHRPDRLPRGGRRRRPPTVGRDHHRPRRRAARARRCTVIDWSPEAAEKGGYEHFMLKEIHEQPSRSASRIAGRVDRDDRIALDELAGLEDASGRSPGSSSSPAAAPTTPSLIGAAALQDWTGLPARANIGSEFRYSPPPLDERTLVIAVTQSGETADTIAPTRLARERGCPVIAVTNTVGSAITREADAVLFLQAGPEIAVAASKTFVTQVTTLVILAAAIAKVRGTLARGRRAGARGARSGRCRPRPPGRSTRPRSPRPDLARRYVNSRGFMFVGRGRDLPGRARGCAQAQGGQLRPRRGLRGGRAQARPHLAARRGVSAGRRRDPLGGLRQAHQQRHGGPRPRRPGDRGRDRGRRGDRATTPTTSAGCPTRTRRSARSWPSSRSSCSPTTSPSPGARTSTSRATWPSRSRSSRDADGRRPGGPGRARPSSASTSSRSTGSGRRSTRFGARFTKRVLTEAERRYVRDRPETMAGRWAAKEAVSKVLGLGVRGIGWRDIEIERLPTGQPAVRLHGRAAARAEQLGMERIAVSITPRIGLRGRHRVRGPDGRRPLSSSRPTSRSGSTSASGGSSPGSSACASTAEAGGADGARVRRPAAASREEPPRA